MPSRIRLSAAAGLVRNGDVLCDVGSDHAYLPLMLISSGTISRAIACDINPEPLKRGEEHAVKQGVDSIEFILSDGLKSVDKDFDVAAICGMGGELIIKIITEGGDKAKRRLILQPMTGAEKLRKFLWQNGFEITDEVFAVEDGKAYCIIGADFTANNTDFCYSELYLGKIRPSNREFSEWAAKIRRAAEKRINGARDSEDESRIKELIAECEKYET